MYLSHALEFFACFNDCFDFLKARDLLRRIRKRDLFKLIGQTILKDKILKVIKDSCGFIKSSCSPVCKTLSLAYILTNILFYFEKSQFRCQNCINIVKFQGAIKFFSVS